MSGEINFKGEYSQANAIKYFRQCSIDLAPKATEVDILTIEKQLDFKFPNDFIKFNQLCKGFLNGSFEQSLITIWTFDMMRNAINEAPNDKQFIPIADYLIDSHRYGYIRDKEGIYTDYDCRYPVANNFDDFLKLMLTDSDSLIN